MQNRKGSVCGEHYFRVLAPPYSKNMGRVDGVHSKLRVC